MTSLELLCSGLILLDAHHAALAASNVPSTYRQQPAAAAAAISASASRNSEGLVACRPCTGEATSISWNRELNDCLWPLVHMNAWTMPCHVSHSHPLWIQHGSEKALWFIEPPRCQGVWKSNHWDAKEFGNVLIPALKGLLHSHLTVFLDGKCQTSDVDISGPLEVVQCGKPQDERTYPKPSETNAGGCNGATPLGPWLQSSNLALKQHNQILQHCKVFQHCMFWESCSTHPALKQTSGKLKQTRHIWYLMENSSLQAFSNFLKICFLVALTLGLRQKHHTENTTSWSADSPWQRPCHKNHSSATIFSDVVCSMFFSRSKLWFRFTMITEWTNSEPAKSACFQMSCLEAASAAALLTLT